MHTKNIGLVGADHTRAPLALRERLAVDGARFDALLSRLRDDPVIAEAVVLSTCNRTEIYIASADIRTGLASAGRHLLEVTGVTAGEVAGVLEPRIDREAVRHLFAVASGLRSLALGENQIVGQVRDAFEAAAASGSAGPELAALGRAASTCSKRVRTETRLAHVDASVSALAVERAVARYGALAGRRAVLIGAGRINEVSAQLLREAGVTELVVVSRTFDAAARLASMWGGRAAAMEDLPGELAEADLAIAATRAPAPPVTVASVRPRVAGRPLLIFDIAVPRDVDPEVGAIEGVEVVDLDGLREGSGATDGSMDGVSAAWAIVDEAVDRYAAAVQARRAVPLIARLREHVDQNKDAELARTLASLAHLDQDDRDAVALLAHRLVNRMFHHLATRLKTVSSSPDADTYLAALAVLFDGTGTEYGTVTAPAAERVGDDDVSAVTEEEQVCLRPRSRDRA